MLNTDLGVGVGVAVMCCVGEEECVTHVVGDEVMKEYGEMKHVVHDDVA